MTKTELYTFVTSLLDGEQINTTLFDTLLDVAQQNREGMRNWVILRAEDKTQSISTSNTFATQKSLPSDFRSWYSQNPIVLIDSNNNVQARLKEIPLHKKYDYKDDPNKFYCDYGNKYLYICGSYSQSLTVVQFYKKKSTLVSADDANTWIFGTDYDKALGFDVAVMYKLGIDYDVINNVQGNNNAAIANRIMEMAEQWDGELQQSALLGQDYSGGDNVPINKGHMNNW